MKPRVAAFVVVAGLALNGCTTTASTPAPRHSSGAQPRPSSRLSHWLSASPAQAGVLLPAGCDRGDVRLDEAATLVAQGGDASALAVKLTQLGVPQVWPQAFRAAYASPNTVSYRAAETWLAHLHTRGERRCGVALLSDANHTATLAVVAVDSLVELMAFPSQARIGQWLTLEFHALPQSKESQVWVRDPAGQSFTLTTHRNGDRVRALFTARTPGRHHIQVLERFDAGPVPALEFYCDVAVDPAANDGNSTMPLENRDTATLRDAAARQGTSHTAEAGEPVNRAARESLYANLASERAATGAPPLFRDATLERLAQEHAQAMAERSELSHDVGLGSPLERAASVELRAARVAENVADGVTPASAQAALWSSASHRANWLNPGLNAIGIGMARDIQGRWWISQMFGEMRSPDTNLPPADRTGPNRVQAF